MLPIAQEEKDTDAGPEEDNGKSYYEAYEACVYPWSEEWADISGAGLRD